MTMPAYSEALAYESMREIGSWDAENEVFNEVSVANIEKFARIVAYKVAKNIANGKEMDKSMDPLVYV